ncbi:MAG: hypothetical protein HGA87_04410 [Desulfobulbaceae bacterium]|nr:hypothetical protein [Desulfobulbaceae bacterium]
MLNAFQNGTKEAAGTDKRVCQVLNVFQNRTKETAGTGTSTYLLILHIAMIQPNPLEPDRLSCLPLACRCPSFSASPAQHRSQATLLAQPETWAFSRTPLYAVPYLGLSLLPAARLKPSVGRLEPILPYCEKGLFLSMENVAG